ncbi:MAG: efflux RND transporter periplasmic adaptor subunit [Verrucomicrobiales bacterium]
MKAKRLTIQIAASLLAFGAAGGAALVLLKTAPTTEPGEKSSKPKMVRVIDLAPSDERIVVSAWGTVIPAREITMQPRVSGRVVRQSEALVPGGRLAAGEMLVEIDGDDYKLALAERMAELEDAKYELEVERGRQIIAKREWEQLREDVPEADANPALALREPHLRRAEAMVAKAQNAIAQAELALKRTAVAAPFNGMVTEEAVEVGQLVDPNTDICRLVGTDAFWIRATLPVADLARVRLPADGEPGAAAKIYLDTGEPGAAPWDGTVVRLLSDLEPSGRMARLIVAVADPLGEAGGAAARTPLLLGSYVRADIEAGVLRGVLAIPRAALREGDRVWLVGGDDRLRIADAKILWTRPGTVLIEDVLEPGERLVVSELKAALPEMAVNPQPLEQGGGSAAPGAR